MTLTKLSLLLILLTIISCTESKVVSPLLDNLVAKDTITLYARYSECGEWGGHIDKILLTKEEAELRATLYKDSMTCLPGPDFGKRTKLSETSKILSVKERNKITRYIDTFLLATKFNEAPDMNASNVFKLILKDTTYEYINWKFNWAEFNTLRNDLFFKKEEHANR